MKKKVGILFDLDGTVLFTDELIRQSFIITFAKYKPGYTLSETELLSFLGPSLKETFSKYFDVELVPEVIKYYQQYNHKVEKHEEYVYVYPTVEETLKLLQFRGYPLAIVTTKARKAAKIGLDVFNLSSYFDAVIGIEDVQVTKPDPEGIQKAMQILGVEKAVMIGDNVSDIQAGKNANVHTIGVKWSPKGYQELVQLQPDLLVDEMKDIIPYIEKECE